MKKAILFVVGLIALSMITNANGDQKVFKLTKPGSEGKCYDENTRLINLGVGFGSAYYAGFGYGVGYTRSSFPSISASYEQPWPQRLGPGFLGVGAYVAYQSSVYRYNDYVYMNNSYYYEHRYSNSVIAARATYHWDGLVAEKAEVYGGAIAGIRIRTYSYVSNSPDPNKNNYKASKAGSVLPSYSVFAGARWYPIPKIALFAEAGYGTSFITAGVTFKL